MKVGTIFAPVFQCSLLFGPERLIPKVVQGLEQPESDSQKLQSSASLVFLCTPKRRLKCLAVRDLAVIYTTWKVCAIAFSQAIARNQQVFDQIWKVKGKVRN